MPVFYKQDGSWKNVNSPYVKQSGNWISPEQVYMKKDGEWKLVFEEFNFTVETLSNETTTYATVLKGRLTEFESFEEETYFFDQPIEERTENIRATATDSSRKLIAVGGGDNEVFVYDNNLAIDRTTANPYVSRIDQLDSVEEPSEQINGIGFSESQNKMVVASGKLYSYDEDFGLIETKETDGGSKYADVAVEDDYIVAGSGSLYAYEFSGGSVNRLGKVGLSGKVQSIDVYSGSAAVGTDSGEVYVYDNSLSQPPNSPITGLTGETAVSFNQNNGRLAVADENNVRVYESDFGSVTSTFDLGYGGDLDWDKRDNVIHASEDQRIIIFDGDGSGSFEPSHTFKNASKKYRSVSWDGENQYAIAGTGELGTGEVQIYSTGVRAFFDWSKNSENFENRQRASGLRSTGDPGGNFEFGLDGLDPNVQYKFRAGAFAKDERTVIDNSSLTFTTADLQVSTDPVTNRKNYTVTLNGTITNLDDSGNAEARFRWGETGTGFPNQTQVQTFSASGASGQSFSETIDVTPDVEYEYKAKVVYGGLTVFGNEETFLSKDVKAQLASSVSDPTDFGKAFEDPNDGTDTVTKGIAVEEPSGTGPFQIEASTEIVGADPNEFTIETALPKTVEAGTTQDIDVTFEAINDGERQAKLRVFHDAPRGRVNDPLEVALEGTVEKAVNLEVPGTTFTTTADQNQETKTFNINETGGDYAATITSIVEDNNQPGNNESSEWEITNRPGNLGSGGNVTVPAGGTVSFEVGWNPDTGDAQDYKIVINYEGQGVPDSESEEITINGTVSGIVNITVDPERDGNTSRGVTDGSFTYTYTDGLDPDTLEDVVPFSIVGDKDGDYTVNEISISGTDSEDFFIPESGKGSLPNSTTDGDSSTGQLVNITDPGEIRFDVVFNPSTSDTPGQSEWNANLDIEADNANNNTHSINLVGLQPSEITTTPASSLSVGTSIIGGNLSGETNVDVNPVNEKATAQVTVENLSSDRSFDIIDDSSKTEDFDVVSSVAGNTVTGSDTFNAEIEFVPNPRSGEDNDGYSDGDSESGTYSIAHDAEFGSNPKQVSLNGTVQVTNLNFKDDGGDSFDPSKDGPHITIIGDKGSSYAETFEVSLGSGNSKSTEIVIGTAGDSTSNSISLLGSGGNGILTPSNNNSLYATVIYSPSGDKDIGDREYVEVEWDNRNISETVIIEGTIGSAIDIETQDGSPNDGKLEFTTTENTTDSLDVVVKEIRGSKSFKIKSTGQANGDARFAKSNDFDNGAGFPVEVSPNSQKSATIDFSPNDGDGGNGPYTGTFEFNHDAFIEPATYEEAPVDINLSGTVLTRASVSLSEEASGDNVAKYEKIEGGSTSTTTEVGGIEISETVDNGQDEVTVIAFDVLDDTDSAFSLNESDDAVDTSDPGDVDGSSFTISSGGSTTGKYVTFSPPLDTSEIDGPDTLTADFQVKWTAEGYDTTQTSTINVSGDALEPSTAKIENSISFARWANIVGIDENTGGYQGGAGVDAVETVTIQEVYGNEGYSLNSVSYTDPQNNNESDSPFNFPDKSSYNFTEGESITRDVEYYHPDSTSDPAASSSGIVGAFSGEYTINTDATQTENGSLQVETYVTSLTAIATISNQESNTITFEWNISWNISGFGSSNKDGQFYNRTGTSSGVDQNFVVNSEIPTTGKTISSTYSKGSTQESVDVKFDIYDSNSSNPIARTYDSVNVPARDDEVA